MKDHRNFIPNAQARELLNSRNKPPTARWQSKQSESGQEEAPKKPRSKSKSRANAITTAAIDWLNLNGFKAFRNNNGGVWDPVKQCFRRNKNLLKGVPDICGYQKGTGRALYIEVKAGKDKLSPEQIQFLAEAEKGGAITGVIHESIEIEEIINKYKTAA